MWGSRYYNFGRWLIFFIKNKETITVCNIGLGLVWWVKNKRGQRWRRRRSSRRSQITKQSNCESINRWWFKFPSKSWKMQWRKMQQVYKFLNFLIMHISFYIISNALLTMTTGCSMFNISVTLVLSGMFYELFLFVYCVLFFLFCFK